MVLVKLLYYLVIYPWYCLYPIIELSSQFLLQSYRKLLSLRECSQMLRAPDCLQNDPPGLLGLVGCQFSKQSIQISLHEERLFQLFWLSIISGLIMQSTLQDKLFVFFLILTGITWKTMWVYYYNNFHTVIKNMSM